MVVLAATWGAGRWTPASEVTVRPERIDDVLTNPNMGFADFHMGWHCESRAIRLEECVRRIAWPANYPETAVTYFRWYWDQLEPEPGEIDFDYIDTRIQASNLTGQTLSFRVMAIREAGAGIPSRREVKGVQANGTFWPDYRDPVFQQAQRCFGTAQKRVCRERLRNRLPSTVRVRAIDRVNGRLATVALEIHAIESPRHGVPTKVITWSPMSGASIAKVERPERAWQGRPEGLAGEAASRIVVEFSHRWTVSAQHKAGLPGNAGIVPAAGERRARRNRGQVGPNATRRPEWDNRNCDVPAGGGFPDRWHS